MFRSIRSKAVFFLRQGCWVSEFLTVASHGRLPECLLLAVSEPSRRPFNPLTFWFRFRNFRNLCRSISDAGPGFANVSSETFCDRRLSAQFPVNFPTYCAAYGSVFLSTYGFVFFIVETCAMQAPGRGRREGYRPISRPSESPDHRSQMRNAEFRCRFATATIKKPHHRRSLIPHSAFRTRHLIILPIILGPAVLHIAPGIL